MRVIRFVDRNELREFFFKQFIFCLEAVDLAEGLRQKFTNGDAPIGLHRLAELVEVEKILRLVEQRGNNGVLRRLLLLRKRASLPPDAVF